MSLPEAVLRTHPDLHEAFGRTPGALRATRARGLLLDVDGSPVLLLHGRDRAVEPGTLAAQLDGTVRAADPATVRAYRDELIARGHVTRDGDEPGAGALRLPTLPRLHGIRVCVDVALLGEAAIEVDVDGSGRHHVLDREAVRTAFGRVERLACTRPIARDRFETVRFVNDRQELDGAVASLTARRIGKRLDEALNVPPLPEAARRIVELQLKPDFDLTDLTAVIEGDPSLAAQIVGWANSSLYNAPGTVESIDDAVMRVLGFDLVLNLALGLAVSRTLRVPPREPGFTYGFWQRSVYTGALVESLARAARRPLSGLGYLSGLLHDFGYLVLAHAFPPQFDELIGVRSLNDHVSACDLETTWLGLNRAQLGAHLLDNWSLPFPVVDAIRRQNDPRTLGEGCNYADMLHLAKRALGETGVLDMPVREPLPAQAFTDVGVARPTVDELVGIVMGAAGEFEPLCRALDGGR
jgi:HD-like signal output (HDOD) protein